MGFAFTNAYRMHVVGGTADFDMGHNRTIFLRKSREVEPSNALIFQMRRHAHNLTNGDNTRASDAGNQDIECRIADIREGWIGQFGDVGGGNFNEFARIRFDKLAAFDRDEAGAKALQARKVLVATRLIDLAFAAEFGFEGLYRNTI